MSGLASMNDIKNRIKSVESTMQITKAMELVATSKLRRAKELAERSKPFLEALLSEVRSIYPTLDGGALPSSVGGRTLYIVIAGDRGRAGGYNSNVFKLAASLDKEGDGLYLPVGKKANEYFARRGRDIFSERLTEADGVGVGRCLKLGEKLASAYISGEISEIKLIYTKFKSMLTQIPVCERILPVDSESEAMGDPIMEDTPEEFFSGILPQYVGGALYAALSESVASECAARRTAMNSANKNAEEMIGTLTLSFNRARQAVITQEITEIVSGAEAL